MQARAVRSAIGHADADEDVVDVGLGVFDLNVEVTVTVEDARIDQLELGVLARAPPVLAVELRVRELSLRIFVQALHVRVSWRRVEVIIDLLDVLAMIALI